MKNANFSKLLLRKENENLYLWSEMPHVAIPNQFKAFLKKVPELILKPIKKHFL